MKKIKPKGLSFALSFSFCILAVLILFPSCDLFKYKRIFPDAYYDDNLIEKIGFTKAIASNAVLPETDPVSGGVIPVSGLWDFAWRYEHYLAEETPYPYMTLTPVVFTGSRPQGLLPSSQVFRLELENLVSDGDFESVIPPARPVNWVTSSGIDIFKTLGGFGNINGNSLQIEMKNNDDFVRYTINMPAGAAVGNTGYNLFFKWASDLPLTNQSGAYTVNAARISFSNPLSELVGFTSGPTNEFNELAFYNTSLSSLVIDDISVKRSLSNAKMRLLLSPGDTEPQLMNMLYRFSMWVCADPSVDPLKSPYHLSNFTIDIKQLQTKEINSMTTKPGLYSYDPLVSGWQKIEAYIDGGNPQFPEDSLTPVLELVISLADSLPGRVLLAQPELRAFPDGY